MSPSPLRLPRVVIGAPASGAGKTTLATGLAAALVARGLAVSPHKVGPDYIDPGYPGLAAGRPGRNLDPFLCGERRMAPLLRHGASIPAPADIAVIEGAMGLYDGAAGRGEFASTAHVAKLLDAPVLLVVDASGAGRSVAALVTGFARYDPAVRIGGLILNRVGSDRHEAILRDALDDVGIPVLGVLRRQADIATPFRHLGLVPVAERSEQATSGVQALAQLVERDVDVEGVLRLAYTAPPLQAPPWDLATEVRQGGPPVRGRPRVAVAGGAAFTFCYPENAELLDAAGAEVVSVDPLRDRALPADVRGLVLGGGFPQVHAGGLAANAAFTASVAGFDGPIVAECAGLLYLARSLDAHPMCAVLPTDARMTGRLTLGYREAVSVEDSVLTRTGERINGHEFHRTTCDPDPGQAWAWSTSTGPVRAGFADARVHASYLHVHWAGHPQLARRFVAACA